MFPTNAIKKVKVKEAGFVPHCEKLASEVLRGELLTMGRNTNPALHFYCILWGTYLPLETMCRTSYLNIVRLVTFFFDLST